MDNWILVLWIGIFSMIGCNDETAGPEKPTCEFGQRYNATDNACEPLDSNNTSTNNSSSSNNAVPDMGSPDMAPQTDMSVEEDISAPDLPAFVCGTGSLRGKTCSPDGDILATATVTVTGIDCETGLAFTLTEQSDIFGVFTFTDLPTGQHDLKVEIGSFTGVDTVFVRADETTDLTASADKICLDPTLVKIAVIGGINDQIETILDGLRLTYDMKGSDWSSTEIDTATQFLQNPAEMATYDIILINCGILYEALAPLYSYSIDPRPAIAANLRNFVNQGGSLYASDNAHTWVEATFPDLLDLMDKRLGYAPQAIVADVLSPALLAVLNTPTITIEFPHNTAAGVRNNNWTALNGADPTASIHLAGPVKLCGPPNALDPCPDANTIQVNTPLLLSWKATSGGTVSYTSFHSNRQIGLTQDMLKILRFLIFQL